MTLRTDFINSLVTPQPKSETHTIAYNSDFEEYGVWIDFIHHPLMAVTGTIGGVNFGTKVDTAPSSGQIRMPDGNRAENYGRWVQCNSADNGKTLVINYTAERGSIIAEELNAAFAQINANAADIADLLSRVETLETGLTTSFFPITANTIGLWRFNGTATDASPNNHDGIENNITYNAASFGQGAVFNGSTSFVDLGLLPVASRFTLEFLIANKGTLKAAYWWARQNSTPKYPNFGVAIFSNGDLHVVANSDNTAPSSNTSDLTTSITYNDIQNGDYLAVSVDYPTVKVYLYHNKTLVKSYTGTLTIPVDTHPEAKTSIGRSGEVNNYYFDGTFDEVRYSDIPYTAEEIAAIANNMP